MSEEIQKHFDINTVLICILLTLCLCCFGFLFWQNYILCGTREIQVTEFQGQVNLNDNTIKKIPKIGGMLAPIGLRESMSEKPTVPNALFTGVINALMIEATIGTAIYAAWTHSPTAGVISLGLGYATYKIIQRAL